MRILNKSLSKRDLQNKVKELEGKLVDLELKASKASHGAINAETVSTTNHLSLLALKNESLFFFVYNTIDEKIISHEESPAFLGLKLGSELSSFLQVIHPDDVDEIKRLFQSGLSEVSPRQCRFRVPVLVKEYKEQQHFMLTISVIPPPAKGQYICTIRNITRETKVQKDTLKGRERAEEAEKLKNIFLSKISHYIRTPMNSIVGFAELLTTYSPDDKQKKEYLDVIKRQSKSLLNVVNEIAEISKYSSGNIEISKTNINLNLVINETIIGFVPPLRSDSHVEQQISTSYPTDEGIHVFADSGRIQQILNNLMNFTTSRLDHGRVTIAYELVDDKVIFSVHDNQVILKKKERKNFFNLYLIHDESEPTRYEDTGIGLTIAKTIVKALGGKIWVDSEEEKGTSYCFSIPYEAPIESDLDEKNEVAVYEYDSTYDWRNSTILIVDDEEVNALFLEALLQNTKARLLFAKNGFEALELCKTINQIDLVLMDILMPGMNGLKATQEIRKFNVKIPIIAQTALTESEDYNQCILAGCNEAITKPIEVEKLLRLISGFL